MKAAVLVPAGTYSLGDLMSLLYERFLKEFGDAELASVAAAAVINDVLASRDPKKPAVSYVY